MFSLEKINFGQNGLIPAIVQDAQTRQVLMLAYMNRESLQISLQEGYTCFYSRSRQKLWRKGETSGHTQKIISLTADCDSDALLIRVLPQGPACHTEAVSCFFNSIFGNDEGGYSLAMLQALLKERKKKLPEGSYTTYLFQKGKEKILKKVGEECTEVIIGAMKGSKEETIYEIADLAYHTLVLMTEMGIDAADIASELQKRHVVDHKIKQETMK